MKPTVCVLLLLAVLRETAATWRPSIVSEYLAEKGVLKVSVRPPKSDAGSYDVCAEKVSSDNECLGEVTLVKQSNTEVVFEIGDLQSGDSYRVMVEAYNSPLKLVPVGRRLNRTVVLIPGIHKQRPPGTPGSDESAGAPPVVDSTQQNKDTTGAQPSSHHGPNQKLIFIFVGVIAVVLVFIIGVLVLLHCTRQMKRQPISRRTSQRGNDYTETDYLPRTPSASGYTPPPYTPREGQSPFKVSSDPRERQPLQPKTVTEADKDLSPCSVGESDNGYHTLPSCSNDGSVVIVSSCNGYYVPQAVAQTEREGLLSGYPRDSDCDYCGVRYQPQTHHVVVHDEEPVDAGCLPDQVPSDPQLVSQDGIRIVICQHCHGTEHTDVSGMGTASEHEDTLSHEKFGVSEIRPGPQQHPSSIPPDHSQIEMDSARPHSHNFRTAQEPSVENLETEGNCSSECPSEANHPRVTVHASQQPRNNSSAGRQIFFGDGFQIPGTGGEPTECFDSQGRSVSQQLQEVNEKNEPYWTTGNND